MLLDDIEYGLSYEGMVSGIGSIKAKVSTTS
jgi:hypothetical protein